MIPPLSSRPALAVAVALALVFALPAGAAEPAAVPALETVVVSAQRVSEDLEAERAATPGAVTTVDGEDLYRRGVAQLADLLRYVPGVWAESATGTDEVFFSSRGSNLDATDFDKNGIKFLQDGLPVTTADGNNHNRALDPLGARYVTVAHGANALAYGASTLGGAIDFTSPTARTYAPFSAFVSGGSNGALTARATAGAVTGPFDGLFTLESRNWDGYRNHGHQERKGAHANVGWQGSDGVTTRVYVSLISSDEQLPGALTRAEMQSDPDQASPAALAGNYQKNVDTLRVATKTTWTIDEHSSFELGASYEHQSLYHPIVDRVLVDFDGPGPAAPVEVFSLLVDTRDQEVGAMLRYRLTVGDHALAFGANAGDGSVFGGNYRNLGGARNGLREIVDDDATSVEVFALDRWRFRPDWTLIYGGQAVRASRSVRTVNATSGAVRNPSNDYSGFNPRIGAIRALGEATEAFASVSRLFEAPTDYELQDDVRGNDATLDAMRGTVGEIGLRGSATTGRTRWHWDVAAYYARIRHEILSVDDPAAPGNSLSTNIDRTTHAGVEALLGASFEVGGDGHRLEPLLSATFNDFSFDSDPVYGDRRLPAAPRYFARGELLYRHPSGFYAGPTLDRVGRRYADFANTYAVGSYPLYGLRAGRDGTTWDVFGEIRNLQDREYVATVTVLDRAGPGARVLNPGAPRSVYVGARFRLP